MQLRPCTPAALLFFWLTLTGSLHAETQKLWQMNRASWSPREGSPRDINAIAQTPDGMLWIGSEQGLYTFNGFEFQSTQAVADASGETRKQIMQLLVAKDGTVWWSARGGGAVCLSADKIRTFSKVQGRPELRNINSLQEDHNGTLWGVFDDKTPAFLGADGLWHAINLPLGDGPHVQSFFIDQTGAKWLVQQNTLYLQASKQTGFTKTALKVNGPSSIRQAGSAGVWIASMRAELGRTNNNDDAVLTYVDPSAKSSPTVTLRGPIKQWMITGDGDAWLVLEADGLRKINRSSLANGFPDNTDTLNRLDGFTSDRPNSLFQDMDGNVWVGGSHGLTRFSSATLVRALREQKTTFWSTCIDGRNDLLAGADGSVLTRIHQGHSLTVPEVFNVSGLYCDSDAVWVLDAKGIAKVAGGRTSYLPPLPQHSGFWDDYIFSAILQADAHTLYAWATGANEDALWAYRNRHWRRIGDKEKFGRVMAMRADGEGHSFFGRRDGNIDIVATQDDTVLSVNPGGIGAVLGFARTKQGWAAFGRAGTTLLISGHFQPLLFANSLVGSRVTGLVQSRNGDWWINSAAGIARLPKTEVDLAISKAGYKVTGEQISGVAETAPLSFAPTGGSAYVDHDGLLWFATKDGVVSVDPDHLPVVSAPRLKILSLTGDGNASINGAFESGLQTLRIQYIGIHLAEPSSVVYRYLLEAHDKVWQEVGGRREAVYTDLKPGTYRFAVRASVAGQQWTNVVYSSSFAIRPRFYQATWFQVLCAVAAICIAFAGIRLRIQHLSHLHQLQAEARAEERIRISRNLHDTLLQGLQGLILRFESVKKLTPPSAQIHSAFESALLRAEQLVVESRTRLMELRAEAPDTLQLPSALKGVADMFRKEGGPACAVVAHGERRSLTGTVYTGVYQIAAAAIANAFLHSEANTLGVEIHYDSDLFRLTCSDDGIGMSPDVARNGRSGHWGIIGMRENAREIGACFDLRSSPGAGTHMELTLDAAVAYES